jgi:hypothetical protein
VACLAAIVRINMAVLGFHVGFAGFPFGICRLNNYA